jgi:hypothetical protein
MESIKSNKSNVLSATIQSNISKKHSEESVALSFPLNGNINI